MSQTCSCDDTDLGDCLYRDYVGVPRWEHLKMAAAGFFRPDDLSADHPAATDNWRHVLLKLEINCDSRYGFNNFH